MKRIISYVCVCLISIFGVEPGFAIDNGLARTPPMGWNSWQGYRLGINEQEMRATADFFVQSGMKAAGYQYVVIDGGWKSMQRDSQGRLVPDPKKFPSGMKALADYIHSRGLKFGIYTDAGTKDCDSGLPGSAGHEQIDAQTFADWGVDYIKEDWCNSAGLNAQVVYTKMSNAIKATGRPMVFSLCEWGDNKPWLWTPQVGNLWRTTGDDRDCWDCGRATMNKLGGYPRGWTLILDAQIPLQQYAGLGHWNDPDMLEIGMPGLNENEARAQFSLWSILAAPLMVSCNLLKMPHEYLTILLNKEVIAVDQDPAGMQGTRIASTPDGDVWMRRLADGSRAVVLFNRTRTAHRMHVRWQDLGESLQANVRVRDLWEHMDKGTFRGEYAAQVPEHGVVMLRIKPL